MAIQGLYEKQATSMIQLEAAMAQLDGLQTLQQHCQPIAGSVREIGTARAKLRSGSCSEGSAGAGDS